MSGPGRPVWFRAIVALPLALLLLMLPPLAPASAAVPPQTPSPPWVGDPATPTDTPLVVEVVEHLRLRVPAEGRKAWLIAERDCWEPWLRHQQGFLGRDLYWDAAREEGVLLIHWASKEAWDAIPGAEVEAVQRRFEARARSVLGRGGANPFPLLESGSLAPVGRTGVAAS